jgi:TonB family protein
MKRFILIYLPIICITIAAGVKLMNKESYDAFRNESESSANFDPITKDNSIKSDEKKDDSQLQALQEQIEILSDKVGNLKDENNNLAAEISGIKSQEEEEQIIPEETLKKSRISQESDVTITDRKESSTKEGIDDIEVIEESEDAEDDKIFNFSSVENKPIFPGCENLVTEPEKFMCFNQNIMEHIGKKFEFPELARQLGIQGKVYINFVIEKNGKVSNVTIARGVDKLIDDEAIRVIKLLPKFTPAKQRGKPVRMQYTVPINARLQ